MNSQESEDFYKKLYEILLNVTRSPEEDMQGYLAALKSLDSIASEQKGHLPGDLHHYLERRSYVKALHFCENALAQ